MNPLLLDIPGELRSDRLLLRVPRAGDGAIVYPSVRESLAELKPWMPWATDDYNEQGCEEWCRRAAAEFLSRKQLQFLVLSLDGSQHLGTIGAHHFDWDIPSCEIGYWMRTTHTGRGQMTESVLLLLKMLREVLHVRRVQIRTDEENLKSRAVAERAGFQLEGILRKDCVATGGRLRNTCVYSCISPGESV
jgi:RimJ/RimL family protein N-acetyltransferase